MGYSLLLASDADRDRDGVLSDYRSRDAVEKLFDVLKNENGQGRLRTGDDTVAAGRLFVAFVGTILRLSLEDGKRRCGLLERMSVPEAFVGLRKVRTLLSVDGRRHHLEIPKKTRDILAALQIPPPK
jgi:transposase